MEETFDSVVIYGSWLETARKRLPEDDVGRFMVQLIEYGLNGKIPDDDNAIMATMFDMAKPNIDSNIRKRKNGRKGGRPSKKTSGLSNGNANANANGNGNGNDNSNGNASSACASATGNAEDAASEEPEWMRNDE